MSVCRTCSFTSGRLFVKEWHSFSEEVWGDQHLAQVVSTMLTPTVTQALPESWQGKYTIDRATTWIEERDQEGATLLVLDRSSRTPVGLMILFEDEDQHPGRTIRLGYLLSESAWGQGLANELVEGFVDWCRSVEIASVIGGVERDNLPSQRVLEKNGFVRLPTIEEHGDLLFELRL